MGDCGLHPCSLDIERLLQDCRFERTRRSGPGGQHRNKTETAVVVTHTPSGISAEANERRSQASNREVAIHRLRVRLAVRVRAIGDDAPSELWQRRTAHGRISVAAGHVDFPPLLAEVLDVLQRSDFALSAAAKALGVSSSSLLRLIEKERPATLWVNEQRELRGMAPLKF